VEVGRAAGGRGGRGWGWRGLRACSRPGRK
jgi:hypothetical protein